MTQVGHDASRLDPRVALLLKSIEPRQDLLLVTVIGEAVRGYSLGSKVSAEQPLVLTGNGRQWVSFRVEKNRLGQLHLTELFAGEPEP